MRKAKDKRQDTVVKKQLYETYIEPYYTVQFVLDGRDTAMAMWRTS